MDPATGHEWSAGGTLEWKTRLEWEVYGEPANHIPRNIIFSLRMNAETDASVQNCFEITRQTVQNPCVRDAKVQVGEPRIVAVCHRESYGRGVKFSLSVHEGIYLFSHLFHLARHFS